VWRQNDPSLKARVFLSISRIACTGLFMLRTRRGAGLHGAGKTTNSMPNPQVVMVVRACVHACEHASVGAGVHVRQGQARLIDWKPLRWVK
jgi:hypothetical protein